MPVLVKRCRSLVICVKSFSTKGFSSGSAGVLNMTELAPEEFTACVAQQHGESRIAVRREQTTALVEGAMSLCNFSCTRHASEADAY